MDQKAGQKERSANLDTVLLQHVLGRWPVYPGQKASLRAPVYGFSLIATTATARPRPSI